MRYKLALGVHLQFALNECIIEKVFSTKMNLAYVSPNFKNVIKWIEQTIDQFLYLQELQKISERILLLQMTDFIAKHKIKNKEQIGFRDSENNSANDAVLKLTKTVSSSLNQNKNSIVVFVDHAMAFISH